MEANKIAFPVTFPRERLIEQFGPSQHPRPNIQVDRCVERLPVRPARFARSVYFDYRPAALGTQKGDASHIITVAVDNHRTSKCGARRCQFLGAAPVKADSCA